MTRHKSINMISHQDVEREREVKWESSDVEDLSLQDHPSCERISNHRREILLKRNLYSKKHLYIKMKDLHVYTSTPTLPGVTYITFLFSADHRHYDNDNY